jgi:hypothetical protein
LFASGFFTNQLIGSKKFSLRYALADNRELKQKTYLYDDSTFYFIYSSIYLSAICINQT